MKSEQVLMSLQSSHSNYIRKNKLTKAATVLTDKNILLLMGAPGSGKTVLASQIADELFTSNIWVEVTEKDLDPVQFCIHLYKAIKKTFTRFSSANFEEMMQNGTLVAIHYESYIKEIVKDFRKILKKPVVIVFDGAEKLPTIGLACKAVRTALGLSSKKLHFIVTSRRECSTTQFSGKIRSEIKSLTSDFINMDFDEFKSFALTYLDSTEDFSGLEKIYEMSEGWLTGTIAAFQMLQETGSIPDIADLAEYLDDYFRDNNILQAEKKEMRTILLLSLLDEINLDFAIIHNGSARIANQLIFLMDNNHHIYKPNSTIFKFKLIYKEWLRNQCYTKLSKNEIELFLNSAADYYIKKNEIISALGCLVQAKTYSKIESVIREHINYLIISKDTTDISLLLSEIPEHIINSSLWMALAYGLSIHTLSPHKMADLYLSVDKNPALKNDPTAAVICWGGLSEYFAYITGDINKAQSYQNKSNELLADELIFSDEVLLYAFNILYSVSIITSDIDTIKHFQEKDSKTNARIDSHVYKSRHTYFSVYYNLMTFSYKSASDCVDQVIADSRVGNFFSLLSVYLLYIHSGQVYPSAYISTRLREIYKHRLDSFVFHKVWLDVYDAGYAIQIGDLVAARKCVESRPVQNSMTLPDYPSAMLLKYLAVTDALEFDEAAFEKGEQALKLAINSGVSNYYISEIYLTTGIIHTLMGSFKTAEKRLLHALNTSIESKHDIVSASANAYLSYLYMNIGDKDNALEYAVDSMRYLKKLNRHNFICSIKSVLENLLYYSNQSDATSGYAEQIAFRHYNIAFGTNGDIIPVLQVNAFGEMKIMLGGNLMSSEEFSGNFRIMIALLLSSKDYSAHQEVIQSYIWPSSDKDKARKSFDNLMSRFRKLLSDNFYGINPKDYITISNGVVRLINTKCNADELLGLCAEAWTNFEKGEYALTLSNVLNAKDLYQDKYFPFINDIEKVDAKRQYTDRAFLDLLLLIKKLNKLLPDIILLDGYIAKWLNIYIHETEMIQLAYSYYKDKGNSIKCRSILDKFSSYLDSEEYTQAEKDELLYMVKASV